MEANGARSLLWARTRRWRTEATLNYPAYPAGQTPASIGALGLSFAALPDLTRPDERWYDGNMTKQTQENGGKVLPTLREVIEGALGFQLPPLPAPPLTVKNLDKVCAALLDVPPAAIGRPEQNSVFTEAMQRQLGGASNEKLAAVVDGMVADYIEKRS